MADCKSIIPNIEGEENVIAATQHIVRALGTSKNLTEGMRKILEDLDNQLSTMALTSESKGRGVGDFEERLRSIQEKVMNWESDQSMIWDCGADAVSEYLQAIDEAQRLTESLGSLSVNEDGEENELLRRVHSVLQIAMARLEEEFSHILVQNKQSFEPELMSFRSSEGDTVDDDSIISAEDDLVEESLRRDSSSKGSEEFIIDLVHPDVIADLNRIVNAMFASHFDQECCQAYINIRKDALDECLFIILEVEKMSIEEVLKTDWSILTIKIKKWNRAMKIFMRVYLASEKRLCDQIFGEFGSVKPICFVEISKAPVFHLLNFGEAIAIGPRQPDKLFLILDMYEVLADLLPDIDALFLEEAGSSVRFECREVLKRLGDSIRGTVLEFEIAVGSNTSTNPFAGGGIHHLTKYVMNYIKALTGYSGTLNVLLEASDGDDPVSLMPNMLPVDEEENEDSRSSSCASPIALHLKSVSSVLESNLNIKSRLYRDGALQQFFLMNNIYYMVQKVKGPELRPLFGDDWIRQHNGKFQQHAMNYERATWNSVLSLLKDEGICTPGSHSVSKTVLKERFKSFNLAFEEVYRSQTAWLIPDLQLREDLRISVSLKVIQAYRTFMGRHASQLEGSRNIDKYIKYSADDLQSFILDLFEGSPRSLPNSRRR
ncbi:Exocyst complex protein Exo70 [Macleaya cordata]|uniref:Exocyst subunit Exo70 family protein n=1 Tax=Macleaya cordata TaxID=56857 RepID=A0A200PRI5_MACCD|nr:Exocyst complex protein Exo70 [Macleaya cordata]